MLSKRGGEHRSSAVGTLVAMKFTVSFRVQLLVHHLPDARGRARVAARTSTASVGCPAC